MMAWDGKMAQHLIALAIPLEDQSSNASTHVATYNCHYLQFQDI